jgi:hypothetical protein
MDQYRHASATHLKFASSVERTFNFFPKLSKKDPKLDPKLQKEKKISLA